MAIVQDTVALILHWIPRAMIMAGLVGLMIVFGRWASTRRRD